MAQNPVRHNSDTDSSQTKFLHGLQSKTSMEQAPVRYNSDTKSNQKKFLHGLQSKTSMKQGPVRYNSDTESSQKKVVSVERLSLQKSSGQLFDILAKL